jgi:hypothetical protein
MADRECGGEWGTWRKVAMSSGLGLMCISENHVDRIPNLELDAATLKGWSCSTIPGLVCHMDEIKKKWELQKTWTVLRVHSEGSAVECLWTFEIANQLQASVKVLHMVFLGSTSTELVVAGVLQPWPKAKPPALGHLGRLPEAVVFNVDKGDWRSVLTVVDVRSGRVMEDVFEGGMSSALTVRNVAAGQCGKVVAAVVQSDGGGSAVYLYRRQEDTRLWKHSVLLTWSKRRSGWSRVVFMDGDKVAVVFSYNTLRVLDVATRTLLRKIAISEMYVFPTTVVLDTVLVLYAHRKLHFMDSMGVKVSLLNDIPVSTWHNALHFVPLPAGEGLACINNKDVYDGMTNVRRSLFSLDVMWRNPISGCRYAWMQAVVRSNLASSMS